jgi:hypothetical protein
MKAFKKLALVTAIAAAPFAQAELTSIDDSLLGEMTGQAGISIELDTLITIDSFTYTDTDGHGNGAGSITMSGIAFGGDLVADGDALTSSNLKDLVINIDVDATDGIIINLAGTDVQNSLVGANPVDFGLHVDSITASGVTNALASNINIAGALGPIDVAINNTSGTDLINVEAYFEVTSGSLDVDVIGLGITNLVIGQDENPLYSVLKYDGTANEYRQDINAALGLTDADSEAVVAANVDGATGGAAAATNANNMAFVALSIGSENTQYSNLTEGTVLIDNALFVSLDSFNIDVSMDLSMGSTGGTARSLGSIALDNLDLSGTTLHIYGH